jgi:hypothetical protein
MPRSEAKLFVVGREVIEVPEKIKYLDTSVTVRNPRFEGRLPANDLITELSQFRASQEQILLESVFEEGEMLFVKDGSKKILGKVMDVDIIDGETKVTVETDSGVSFWLDPKDLRKIPSKKTFDSE